MHVVPRRHLTSRAGTELHLKMWLLDQAYSLLFKRAGTFAVLLLPMACFYMFGPTQCNFGEERARQARVMADFRELKIQLSGLGTQENLELSVPLDPFAKDPIPYVLLIAPGEVMATSVGPDGILNRNGIQYDPTNGSISSGDIMTTIAANNIFAKSLNSSADSVYEN